MFDIPPNVDEFVYDDNLPNDDDGEFVIREVESGGGSLVPEIIGIVSQDVRVAANGTQVVDVIVEVTDIPGITNYEFRVTKV